MSSLTTSHLLSVYGFGEDNVFVGGAEGTILHFDGKQWTQMDSGGRWTLKRMWGSAPDNLYGVCTDGKILRYDGTVWKPEDTENFPPMSAIWGRGSDDIFVGCRLGKIGRWNGSQWKFMSSGTNTDVAALWGNEECMYAVGFDGLVLRLVGDHWERLTFNSNAELYSICGFGSDNM